MEKNEKKNNFSFSSKTVSSNTPGIYFNILQGSKHVQRSVSSHWNHHTLVPKKISHNRNSSCYLKKSQILTDFSLYVGDGFESYIEANKG